MSEELRDRATAALAVAIAVLARSSHSLARSLAAAPAQWADAPASQRGARASRHLIAAPPRPPVVIAVTPAQPMRVMPPGRWRSLTAMSAGFEIERLLTG